MNTIVKKATVKLVFSPSTGNFRIPTAPKWLSSTTSEFLKSGSEWSFQITRKSEIIDNTMFGEIQFISKQAEYLLIPGTKFNIFGSSQFKCEIEVIQRIG